MVLSRTRLIRRFTPSLIRSCLFGVSVLTTLRSVMRLGSMVIRFEWRRKFRLISLSIMARRILKMLRRRSRCCPISLVVRCRLVGVLLVVLNSLFRLRRFRNKFLMKRMRRSKFNLPLGGPI